MIEGLLSPPNVRSHDNYNEQMDFTEARQWYRDEIGSFDNVVLMGVPEEEVEDYTEIASGILETEAFEDAEIYAHPEEGRGLEQFDHNEIRYDGLPSRIADIEWLSEEIPEDENVAVLSMDYNIRTGTEIDRRMENHDTFGQFALNFPEFQNFSLRNHIKGKIPYAETFKHETWDKEKEFKYNTPQVENNPAVVLNIPFSNNIEAYDEKLDTEVFRHALATLPYGQEMKDIGKRVVNQFH